MKEIKDKKLMKKGYKNGHKAKCLLPLQEQKILSLFFLYIFTFLYKSQSVKLVNTLTIHCIFNIVFINQVLHFLELTL